MNKNLKQFYRKNWVYRCRICGKEVDSLFSIEFHLKQEHIERIKREW